MMRLHHGFSLLELAITLAVVTLLLGGLLVPLSTQIGQRNETATQKQLDEINEALLGFAAANGRLPCPASGASKGLESFAAGGDASNGDCGSASGGAFIGFLPGVTLGLSHVDSEGYAVDAWGNNGHNRIRYAVSSDTLNGVATPFTRIGGMRSATTSWVASAELLHVCASGSGVAISGGAWHCAAAGDATNTLTFNAPVVIWSTGANSATGGTSADEIQNPNPINASSADRIFVSRSRSVTPEFDDIVTWMSPGRLVNRMIVSGQLP
jgi:prepilin-type N-terminal cleavage/methylation domain-containing protein